MRISGWLFLFVLGLLCLGQVACSDPTATNNSGKAADKVLASGPGDKLKKKEGTTSAGTDGKDQVKTEGKEITTASGLKYIDLKEGVGFGAQPGDVVHVYYTGWLTNGTKFDSNVGKDLYPVKLGQGKVIAGWDEGLTGMKPGGKRKLFIPSRLAYGKRGYPDDIPPDADLVFEVEVVRVSQK